LVFEIFVFDKMGDIILRINTINWSSSDDPSISIIIIIVNSPQSSRKFN